MFRRVLSLDAGGRRLKLLLASREGRRLHILKQQSIDLQEEGLVSPEELKTHVLSVLDEWDRPPLALVLPQHLSISQVIDLPLAPDEEVEKLIHEESVKLSGVSESRIVYDFVRLETSAKNRQKFWLTLCQENDIRERISRLGIEQEDICEITTSANALIAAYRASAPLSSRAIVIHLGAQTTVVVVLIAGQGVFAASFQMGGDFFSRSLARLRNCSEDAADALKRSTNLFAGPDASPEFRAIVDGWITELKGQLNDWFKQKGTQSGISSFDLVASGGGFDQPGLLDYVKEKSDLNLQPWPKPAQPEAATPEPGFEVALGAAYQALGLTPQPVSLLPDDYRTGWKKRRTRQRLEFASLALVFVCTLVLALATWHKVSLISRKQTLMAKVQAGQEAVDANRALSTELLNDYEAFRPLFGQQQYTINTLKALALLQQTRSNQSFWYVLVADQRSYFRPPASWISTNKPVRTNAISTAASDTEAAAATTSATPRPGLIAELCIPEDPEGTRRVISQLVQDLKQQRLFSKADLLSDDLRQNLAEPKVLIPDRHFVLALDFAEADFQQSLRWKPNSNAPPSRSAPKRQNPTASPPNEASYQSSK
jgi:Tfp pilus assembly PilM family ATPase